MTERLVMAAPTEAHRALFVEMYQDPESMVFTVSGPLDASAANRRYDRLLHAAESLRFVKRPILERSTGTFVGYAGLDHLVIDGADEIEIGYRLTPSARGRGYATEACAALLTAAASDRDGDVVAVIEPANGPSLQVATKLGLARRGDTALHGVTFEVWTAPLHRFSVTT